MTSPVLSIAIPTFNRARYLELTLDSLQRDLQTIKAGRVEVLVSDNASPDATPAVVAKMIAAGLPIRSIRNETNIGSDANIAQVFNMAAAPYVLILGDDDILMPGALAFLLKELSSQSYGVVCLKPYGYENDPIAERPGRHGQPQVYNDSGAFIAAIGAYVTLISACIINKSLLVDVDARKFCGGNLVQVHLVLGAALAAKKNLFVPDYPVACKRNNSGGYDFSKVFVEELGRIVDSFSPKGLSKSSIRKFERRMILHYFPTYLLWQRQQRSGDLQTTYNRFRARFMRYSLFWIWLAPILRWPRPLAIAWGYGTVAIGRSTSGDFRRGLAFLSHRLRLQRQ